MMTLDSHIVENNRSIIRSEDRFFCSSHSNKHCTYLKRNNSDPTDRFWWRYTCNFHKSIHFFFS